MGDLVTIAVIGLVAGALGLGFGIFFVAPRLARLADRADRAAEEPSDRDD